MNENNTSANPKPLKDANGEITVPFSMGTVLALIPFMVLSLIAAGIYFSGVIQMMLADNELREVDHEAKAIEYLNWALLVNPRLADAYDKRAEARSRMESAKGKRADYSSAQRDIEEALKLSPDSIVYRSTRVDIDHDSQDFRKEIADCTQLIEKKDFQQDDYLDKRADAHYILGEFQDEKADREKVISLLSKATDGYELANRAKQKVFLGLIDDAIHDYESAIAKDSPLDSLNLLALYINSGRTGQAVAECGKIIEMDKKNPEVGYDCDTARQKRAILYLQSGNYTKALADADVLLETYPDITVRKTFRAKVLDAMGRKSEADAQRKKALADAVNEINKLSKDADAESKASAYATRGSYYENNGQWQLALKDYLIALSIEPTPSKYTWCAQMYTKLGDYDNAIKYLAKATDDNADNADFENGYTNLAKVHLAQHKPELAVEDCTKCIMLGGKNAEASHLRAVAYRELGKNDLAKIDDAEAIGLEFSPLPDIN